MPLSQQGAMSDGGSLFAKDELVRIMMQALAKMGMERTLHTLKEESNISMEKDSMVHLRTAVLQGDWNEAVEVLRLISESVPMIEPISFNMCEWHDRKRWSSAQDLGLTFLCVQIYEEHFLEELEKGNHHGAMKVLRSLIKPLFPPASVSERLTRLLLCVSAEDVCREAHWPGTSGGARQALVRNIELWFSPKDMLPSDRLDTLLRQALTYQRAQHPYHSSESKDLKPSLLSDYRPMSDTFPQQCTHILQGHTNEVWVAKFSSKGTILATGGKDGRVILWNTENCMEAVASLQHAEPVSCIAWSSDDTKLLVSTEEDVVEWNLADRRANVLAEHTCSITALQWLPIPLPTYSHQEDMYVTGALDHKVHFWSWGGRKEKTLDFFPYRVLGLDVSPNGQYMVILGWNSPPESSQIKMGEELRLEERQGSQASIQRLTDFMRRYSSSARRVRFPPEYQLVQALLGNSSDAEDFEGSNEPVEASSGGHHINMTGPGSSLEGEFDSNDNISDHYVPPSVRSQSPMKSMRVWVWDNIAQAVVQSFDFYNKYNYISFSQDGRHVLLSQAYGPVHMMDIRTGSIIQKFYGRKATSAVLRTAFAYQGDDFVQDIGAYVTSGSDDGQLCIWHRATGQLLQTNCAHPEGRVNDMVWGRGPACMLASCGDDNTVRIWESAKKMPFRPTERTLQSDTPVYHAPEPQGSCAQREFEVHAPLSRKVQSHQTVSMELRRQGRRSLARQWEGLTAHGPHSSDDANPPFLASAPSQGSAHPTGHATLE